MWKWNRAPYHRRCRIIMMMATVCLLFAAAAHAEVQVSFTAEPSVLRVGEAGRLALTFSGLSDAEPPRFPSVEGLDIQYIGPATQITFVRGQMQRTLTFNYRAVGRKTGDYNLGPYTLQHNGQNIDIPAITLTIVEEKAGATPTEKALSERLFARMSFQPLRLYHRQVFAVTLSIYSDPRINTVGQIGLSDLPATGLSMGRFQELSTDREIIDGTVYTVRRFRALTQALSAGEYTLAPTIRMNLVEARNTRRDPMADLFDTPGFDTFFGRRDTREVLVSVEPLTVTVHPLPADGRPDSFTGAVGQFQFEADVQPRTVDLGEPLTLTMRITGQGNIATLSPPTPRLGDEFRAYDLRTTSENVNPATAYGTRVFEQVVIPGSAEIHEIPTLEFSYFDPEAQAYKIERLGPFELLVNEGSRPREEDVAFALPRTRETEVLGTDILYLKPPPARLRTQDSLLDARQPRFWALQGVPLLVMALAMIHARRRTRLQSNTALARRLKAPRIARRALRRAEAAIQARQRIAFYEAAWQALADYFGNRLNLPPGEVSTQRILDTVQPLSEDDSGWISRFCATCDRVRFGGEHHRDTLSTEETGPLQDDLYMLRTILRRCERMGSVPIKNGGATRLFVPMLLIATGCALALTTLTASGERHRPTADSVADAFDRAAAAYGAERWDEARTIYQQLLADGVVVPELLYNLGNTHYRMEEWGPAMLQYRRAWWINPTDPEIQANMAMAQRKARALLPEYRWYERIAMRLGLPTWSLIFSLGLWSGASLVILSFYASIITIPARRLATVCWLTSLLVLPVLLMRIYQEQYPEAVVATENQVVRFAPLPDATEHFAVPPGTVVRTGAQRDGWVEVQTDGKRGWLQTEVLNRIFPLHDTYSTDKIPLQ